MHQEVLGSDFAWWCSVIRSKEERDTCVQRPTPRGPLRAALVAGHCIFCGGCGAMFEATAADILATYDALHGVTAATMVFVGHEYSHRRLRSSRSSTRAQAARRRRAVADVPVAERLAAVDKALTFGTYAQPPLFLREQGNNNKETYKFRRANMNPDLTLISA